MKLYSLPKRVAVAAIFASFVAACSGQHAIPPGAGGTSSAVRASVANPAPAPTHSSANTKKVGSPQTGWLWIWPDTLKFTNPQPQTLYATTTNNGVLKATSLHPDVATVTPATIVPKLVQGSDPPNYSAQFTVTPMSSGTALISIKDAKGNEVTIYVDVTAQAFTGTWVQKASMPDLRFGASAGVIGDRLYDVGGIVVGAYNTTGTLEAYDPAANSWLVETPMPTARYGAAAAAVGNTLYVMAGNTGLGASDTVEAYDASSDAWAAKAPLPLSLNNPSAAVVDGIVYVIGGSLQTGTAVNSVFAYDPSRNRWFRRAAMPTPRSAVASVAVNGVIYAIGGWGNSSMALRTVEAYDTATNKWSTKAPMPLPNDGLTAGAISGKIYAVAGYEYNALGLNETYDAATNTWSESASMPTNVLNAAGGVINNKLYVAGSQLNPEDQVWEFTP